MKIIGLDVGTKRIGVAYADSNTRIAIPAGFLDVDGSEWQKIAHLANLHNTNWFVVGLPRSNEGNETKQTLYVRQFAKTLTEHIPGAKIRFQDESLTSVEAENRLRTRKKNYEKGEIDAEAAAIILQDFLESFAGGSDIPPLRNLRPQLGPREVTEPRKDGREGTGPKRTVYQKPLQDTLDNAKAITKKESDKVKMTARKTKNKMRKWPIIVILLVIVGAVAGIAVWQHRERLRREYEEYVAWVNSQKAEVFNFTIRPGETIFDVKDHLIEKGYSEQEVEAGFNADYDFSFLKGRPAGASLEGYLYGETYEFYETASVKDILTKYLEGMGKVIADNNLEARYQAQGLSLFEGITLASVVQKESPAGEQATIAQVFLSRLEYGWRLGSDVTVSYALDVLNPDRDRSHNDNAAALSVNSCYNTRVNTGLPCGPISNPNLAALLAVAEPADTSYLFFLTGDDGLMYYSYTEAEHNQNAAIHCQELCNVSL